MHLYRYMASRIGTTEALTLADRLAAWHDAMVAHERSRRVQVGDAEPCADLCPHQEAAELWGEALDTFGEGAQELTFLRRCALDPVNGRSRRSAGPIEGVAGGF
jgi:hypothetical protein